MTSPEMTSPEMMSQEPEIKGRSFPAKIEISWEVFPELLDSRYEQLNCESNLYRVTIDLLPQKSVILFFENDVIFIGNDVSGWSISFVTSYLIGQSFCVSIGQLLMKWSFLIGSFSYVLIGV
jgi:hypothetical protein